MSSVKIRAPLNKEDDYMQDIMKLFPAATGLSVAVAFIILMGGTQQDHLSEVLASTNDSSGTADVQNQTVSYFDNASGYLVSPVMDASSNQTTQLFPAVVMIHEWWGLNDNIKNMANELAEQGYIVLAADMYNGQVATRPSSRKC
jgi:carboxymethylenebutenolidase